jgi:hypothetical protein
VKQEEIIARNVVEILRKKGALSALLDPPSPNPPLIARDQALPETTPFFPSAHRQPPILQVQPGHPLSEIPMSSMSICIWHSQAHFWHFLIHVWHIQVLVWDVHSNVWDIRVWNSQVNVW